MISQNYAEKGIRKQQRGSLTPLQRANLELLLLKIKIKMITEKAN